MRTLCTQVMGMIDFVKWIMNLQVISFNPNVSTFSLRKTQVQKLHALLVWFYWDVMASKDNLMQNRLCCLVSVFSNPN